MTVLAFIRRLFSRYGFHRQPAPQKRDDWQAHPFYTSVEGARNVANDPEYRALMAVGALNMAPSAVKARRLAEIARQRNALKDELAKVIKAKKARAPIYAALRALSIEELNIEGRR
jgi:hypothetical protein